MLTVPTFRFCIYFFARIKLLVQTPEDKPKAVELDISITFSSSSGTRIIGIIGPKVSSKTNSLFELTLSIRIGGRRASLRPG